MYKATKTALSLGIISACTWVIGCGDFITGSKVEDDPNRATEVSADLMFNSIQISGFFMQEGHLARTAAIWTQQMAGTDLQFRSLGTFSFTEADHDGEMNDVYVGGGLIDIRRIIAKNEEQGNRVYAGIAKVWEALSVGTAASIWGDLPYSEALGDVAEPRLDEQWDIYNTLQSLLDAAIADLESDAGSLPPNDLVYGGDNQLWIEAAHSLKARLYMHWAEVDAGNYDRALQQAQLGISSSSGDFKSYHTTVEVEANTWYQFQRERDSYQRAGKFMVDLLQSRDDPRLALYFGTDASGDYSGVDPGDGNTDVSNLSAGFLSPDASSDILTWEETQLIWAECAYKTGDEATALEKLNEVRRGLEMRWSLDDGSLGVASGLSGEALINAIMEEKYIALFLNIEVWNDWKRTNRPALANTSNIPRRLYYSEDERNANSNIPVPSDQPARNDNDPGDNY